MPLNFSIQFYFKATSEGKKCTLKIRSVTVLDYTKCAPSPCTNKNAHRKLKPILYTERVICQHQQIGDLNKAFFSES